MRTATVMPATRSDLHPEAWLVVGALLLAVIGGRAAPAQPPAEGERPLRVVTFNALHGGAMSGWNGQDDHLEARLDLAAEALQALEPDVVALQEASVSSRRGTVSSRLAGRLGMNHVRTSVTFSFLPIRWLSAWLGAFMDFEEGPAILSRFPIVHSETHQLPRCGRPFALRAFVYALLDTPRGRVPVFSTHTAGDPCHTRAVGTLVEQNRGDGPGILMGDFNAVEGSPAITALTVDAGFIDSFRVANPQEPGSTAHQPVTATERRARRRIDYVFLVPGRRVPGAVVASRVVLDRPGVLPGGGALWPSDHYGVLAELALRPPSAGAVPDQREPAQDQDDPHDLTHAGRLLGERPGQHAGGDRRQ